MKKSITFVISGRRGHLLMKDLDVDLSKLSVRARYLAKCIWTTMNDDDFSKVWVESKLSQIELIRQDWHKPNSWTWQFKTWEEFEEDAEDEKRRFGANIFEEHETIVWNWDALRKHETPEDYFERHASEMFKNGRIIRSNVDPKPEPAELLELLVLDDIRENND